MSFNYRHCHNEAEVRSKLIVYFLLPQLGYSPDCWYEEARFRNVRFDFLVINNYLNNSDRHADLQRSFIIETKHPKQNLDDCISQFNNYLHHIAVNYGILTNGKDFRIYQRVSSPGIH